MRGEWDTRSIQSLSSGLSDTISLKVLKVTKCVLGCDDMRTLSLGLCNNSSITTLNLRYNEIRDEGIAAFSENWKDESPIKSLYLGHNPIGPEGAQLLVKAAANHAAMMRLGLQGRTRLVGCSGLEIFQEDPSSFQLSNVKIQVYLQWERC